jgi:hypothetical protein
MYLKKRIKKNFPSLFFLLKAINQLLLVLKKIFIKYLIIFFSKFSIELNFGLHPLISMDKALSFARYGFHNKITFILKNKLISDFKFHNLKDTFYKNFNLFNNIINLSGHKNKTPLSFLEAFTLEEKEMDFVYTNRNNSDLNNYLFYNYNSSKNLFVDEEIDFWHFYLQYIPLFIKIQKNKSFNLLIKKSKTNYFYELLNIFLDSRKLSKKILEISKNHTNFILKNNYVYPYSKNVLLLRRELKKKLHLKYSGNKINKRLYISRNKKDSQLKIPERFVYNEIILLKYLKKKYGFIEYNPDGMSIVDQIKTFNKAECIIAPHGAALSNLIAVNSNICVVELNKDQDIRWHYAKTMNDMNLGKNYYLLIGSLYREIYIKYPLQELKNHLDEILKKYIQSK